MLPWAGSPMEVGPRRLRSPVENVRIRLDPLRRSIAALLSASGVATPRALNLAGQMLWFDAIGAAEFGVSSLPRLLDSLHQGTIAARAEGKVGPERAATAVIDGKDGIGALILARAGEIAGEKARDVGVGLVRVRGIGPVGSAAAIVAGMAVGPVAASALGPGGAWSVALPSADGEPRIADSLLGGPRPPESFTPWQAGLEAGEWLIQAITIAALEPLASFHERVASAARGPEWSGTLEWEGRRQEARERGISLPKDTFTALQTWAERLNAADRLPSP